MRQCEQNTLPRSIYLTSLELQVHADELLRPYDLTLEQFHPLKILHMEGGAVGQKDLCQLTSKTPANMTRILDRLAKKGFVQRNQDPDDRRAFVVRLLDSGEQLVTQLLELFSDYTTRILNGISQEEQAVCHRVFDKINENLRAIDPSS